MIAFRYSIFAMIATFVNLLFQYLSFIFYVGYGSLYLAMSIGTLAGLIVKYVLDKKYIFFYVVNNMKDDTKKFTVYSLLGILTTFIFWGTEIAFDTLSQNPYAKYLGAVIGLSIGYTIKYFLDKKFVFINNEEGI